MKKRYLPDILNAVGNITADIGIIGALTASHPEGVAFPAAVSAITAAELYHPKKSSDPDIPDIKTIRYGLKKSAFAKGIIAAAGLVTGVVDYLGNGNAESLKAMIPSVVIPLGLSTGADLYQNRELKKLQKLIK